jgi:hypothetical protein
MGAKEHPVIALASGPDVLVAFHMSDRNRDLTAIVQLDRNVRDGGIDDLVLEIGGEIERLLTIDQFGAGAGARCQDGEKMGDQPLNQRFRL